ncbi:hypothetical protein FACS1894164_03890 [Spirochaetia bacterium]|nr:hypothetical protein FACS1894164_03890 [Spirochaetia bacterium]
MYLMFLAILLVFVLVPPIDALIEKKKPKEKDVVFTEKMRCKRYVQSMAFLWGAGITIFITCFVAGKSPEVIGIRPIRFHYNIWFTVITLVVCGVAAAYFLYILIVSLTSTKYREEAKKQIAASGGIDMVIPRTKKEKLVFSFVALSAGICEEMIYRGCFMFFLHAVFPGIPVYLIVLIPSVLFGTAHFYQGVQGVIHTGITGAALMCLFLVSDSLIPGMALHFFMDFSSTFLLSEE